MRRVADLWWISSNNLRFYQVSPSMKTSEGVIDECRMAGRLDQFRLSGHAQQRCAERGVGRNDVKQALVSCENADWQEEQKTWKITGGRDLDGDALTLAVAVQHGVVVVTVFEGGE
jgi:hypothetical protein